jgi:sortase A
LIVIGITIIASVIWPLISYELFTAPNLKPQEFLSPIPVHGKETQQDLNLDSNTNLKNPKNWFPEANFPENNKTNITHYTLSIPKFEIEDAVVAIGGEDLSKNLIHYPNTALPGGRGATIIFGHSILEQFFNPENYLAIFSLIPKLELSDDIIIRFDGITYTYRVIDKIEVQPTNLSVLDQPYDNEYLRLITCSPPGTYLRRAVITAALVD